MELIEALRTTGAVRDYQDEPVPDEVVERILETARHAPNGGNRQAWRVVVVKDHDTRRQLRDLYLDTWYAYLAQSAEGMTPFSSLNDRDEEAAAIANAGDIRAAADTGPGAFAEHFDEAPVLLVVLADLRNLATVDRDLDRYTLVGGASIYPFVWSMLLAAREEGLGGVITTMVIRGESEVKRLLHVPDEFAVAAVVAIGKPVKQLRKLSRQPVASFTSVDYLDGQPFGKG